MQVDRDGITYEVKRRWVPWRWRKRDPDLDVDPLVVDGGDDFAIGVVIFLVVLVLAVVAPFVLVWVILGLEILMVVLLLPLFVLLRWTRVLRWPVGVWVGRVLVHEESVRGWGASHRRLDELAEAVRRGEISARHLGSVEGSD